MRNPAFITKRALETEMIERVSDLTGTTLKEARDMWYASLGAIAGVLLEGRQVHLHGIGKFQFFYYAPRPRAAKIWHGVSIPAQVTAGGYTLRFRTARTFRSRLREVIPKNPIMPKPINKHTFKVQAALKAAQEKAP